MDNRLATRVLRLAMRAGVLALGLGTAYGQPVWAAGAQAAPPKAAPAAATAAPDAAAVQRLLDNLDKLWFSARTSADMSMLVKTAHYERTLKLTYWAEGSQQSMVKIKDPPSERGTVTLRIGQDVYNYLPNVERTVKVSSSLRGSGWMGSHFTNDDLMHSAYFTRDYDAKFVSAAQRGKSTLWTLDLVPKAGSTISWSKVHMVIEKDHGIPVSQVFYDEQGTAARTISFSDLKQLGGHLAPAKIRLTPSDAPDEFTELVYEDIRHNQKFAPDFFSLEHLKGL